MKKDRALKILVAAVLCVAVVLACAACGAGAPAEKAPEPESAPAAEKTVNTGKAVYFAGPMFSQAEKDYTLKLAEILEENGYTVFLPQRDGLEAALLQGQTEKEKAQIIFEKDVTEIMKADIVFMVVDGRVPDEGACVELGIAYANGKRCYGVKTDTRSLEIDLDLNPLVSECFIELFKDFDGDSLIKTLRQYLSENDL